MKTAISIPDNIYNSAEKLADRLGTTRSHLYAQAVSSYLAKHQKEGVTKRLNAVYAKSESKVAAELADLQLKSLPKEEW